MVDSDCQQNGNFQGKGRSGDLFQELYSRTQKGLVFFGIQYYAPSFILLDFVYVSVLL
jgi:hypothetical protein